MRDQQDYIKTCPLSSGFHMPAKQAWNTLYVYFFYQLVLSGSFFLLYVSGTGPSLFGQHSQPIFYATSLTYFAITLFSGVFLINRMLPYSPQAQFRILTEIVALTLLMHASGGITSGLGILIAVSVAAGGILAGGQCALMFAALATFAILGEQLYADEHNLFKTTAYTYAGVLSASFFAISALALILARRAEQSEKVARQRGLDVRNLEQLNQYVIQHMQSGVVVIGNDLKVRLMNESASRLLGIQHSRLSLFLSDVSQPCWEHFNHWRENPSENAATMPRPGTHGRTYMQFYAVGEPPNQACIIFLEDLSRMDEQIQQGKLASLGRLTASIAHEIRNPLGAISHASQLLGESESLQLQDARLLEIIDSHSERVNNIVKSILDLSRRENTVKESFPLLPWLKQFQSRFREEFNLSEVTFEPLELDPELEISFDKNHLSQILNNLCANAIKHGQTDPAHPRVLLRTRQQPNSDRVFIEVIDHGDGIDPGALDNIFEPFFTTSRSGTGLGLYLARELAELNQSVLSYHAIPEGGSCFRLNASRSMQVS